MGFRRFDTNGDEPTHTLSIEGVYTAKGSHPNSHFFPPKEKISNILSPNTMRDGIYPSSLRRSRLHKDGESPKHEGGAIMEYGTHHTSS